MYDISAALAQLLAMSSNMQVDKEEHFRLNRFLLFSQPAFAWCLFRHVRNSVEVCNCGKKMLHRK